MARILSFRQARTTEARNHSSPAWRPVSGQARTRPNPSPNRTLPKMIRRRSIHPWRWMRKPQICRLNPGRAHPTSTGSCKRCGKPRRQNASAMAARPTTVRKSRSFWLLPDAPPWLQRLKSRRSARAARAVVACLRFSSHAAAPCSWPQARFCWQSCPIHWFPVCCRTAMRIWR